MFAHISSDIGKSKLSMSDQPCHVWLQKKLVGPTNKGALGVCYRLLYTDLGDGISCTSSPNHNINREKWCLSVMCALKSKSVSEMHFPATWRPKFQNFFHHGGTSWKY